MADSQYSIVNPYNPYNQIRQVSLNLVMCPLNYFSSSGFLLYHNRKPVTALSDDVKLVSIKSKYQSAINISLFRFEFRHYTHIVYVYLLDLKQDEVFGCSLSVGSGTVQSQFWNSHGQQ